MSVAQAQSLLSVSGATVSADAWGSGEAGAQEGISCVWVWGPTSNFLSNRGILFSELSDVVL